MQAIDYDDLIHLENIKTQKERLEQDFLGQYAIRTVLDEEIHELQSKLDDLNLNRLIKLRAIKSKYTPYPVMMFDASSVE